MCQVTHGAAYVHVCKHTHYHSLEKLRCSVCYCIAVGCVSLPMVHCSATSTQHKCSSSQFAPHQLLQSSTCTAVSAARVVIQHLCAVLVGYSTLYAFCLPHHDVWFAMPLSTASPSTVLLITKAGQANLHQSMGPVQVRHSPQILSDSFCTRLPSLLFWDLVVVVPHGQCGCRQM